MEKIKFVLLEKLEKIKTPQWLWIVAAVIMIGAVALWAVYYRKKEGNKGVKIVAAVAACFFVALFAAQMITIMAKSPSVAPDAITAEDVYADYEGEGSVALEKTLQGGPKNGAAYKPGEWINYVVKVTNDGETALENIAMYDDLSYEEWTIDRLEPGESSEKEIAALVEYDTSLFPKKASYLFAGFAILAGFVLFVAGLIVAANDREKTPHKTDVRAMTYGALCVATAFVLSYIKMFSMPLGGSITLASMLPIMLYAYMYGTRRGLLVGVVYGLLQFIQKPEITHWAQVILEYPVAFGLIGLAGISKHIPAGIFKLPIGAVIGGVARFLAHWVAGILFFSQVANLDAVKSSLLYNGGYMLADTIICVVLAFPVAAIVQRAGIGPQEEKKPEQKAA